MRAKMHLIVPATLILNWHEDGEIYKSRSAAHKRGSDAPPSLSLNPFIRAMRLLFIVLFTALDVGQAVYKVGRGRSKA